MKSSTLGLSTRIDKFVFGSSSNSKRFDVEVKILRK